MKKGTNYALWICFCFLFAAFMLVKMPFASLERDLFTSQAEIPQPLTWEDDAREGINPAFPQGLSPDGLQVQAETVTETTTQTAPGKTAGEKVPNYSEGERAVENRETTMEDPQENDNEESGFFPEPFPEEDPEESSEDDPEESFEDDPEESFEDDPEESLEDDPEESLEDDPEESFEDDTEESFEDDTEETPEEDPEISFEGGPEGTLQKDPENDVKVTLEEYDSGDLWEEPEHRSQDVEFGQDPALPSAEEQVYTDEVTLHRVKETAGSNDEGREEEPAAPGGEEDSEDSRSASLENAEEDVSLPTQELYRLLDAAEDVANGGEDVYSAEYEAKAGIGTDPGEGTQEDPEEGTQEDPEEGDQKDPEETGKGDPGLPVDDTPKNYVTPGAAAYTVRKTSDVSKARPGDTVHYTITIQNTGAVTLHSVLSTERFQTAGIQAFFEPKEGVRMSPDRTQALIEELHAGETADLHASVTIPENLTDPTLINQVIVTTQETGTTQIVSRAEVPLSGKETDASKTVSGTSTGQGSGTVQSGGGTKSGTAALTQGTQTVPTAQSYTADPQTAVTPKTGDPSPILWLVLAMILAAGTAVCVLRVIRK